MRVVGATTDPIVSMVLRHDGVPSARSAAGGATPRLGPSPPAGWAVAGRGGGEAAPPGLGDSCSEAISGIGSWGRDIQCVLPPAASTTTLTPSRRPNRTTFETTPERRENQP
jgi:hypothetical protein